MATISTLHKPQSFYKVDETLKCRELLWIEFRTVLNQMFQTESKGIKNKTVMKMHTIIYNALVVPKPRGYKDTEQLYIGIKEYLKHFLQKEMLNAHELKGEELLQFYTNLWEKYHASSKALNSAAAKLNEFCLETRIEKKRRDFLKIYWLALITWKMIVFDKVHEGVTEAVLVLIEKDRRGEKIDTSVISRVTHSYVELGLVDTGDKWYTLVETIATRIEREDPHLTIYREYFEKDFWMTTESVYMKEAVELLKENTDFDECTQKMLKRLEEEHRRVEMYLHKSTDERLEKSFAVVFKMISDSCFGWNHFLYKFEKF